jgi:hypothetical protein
MEAGEEGVRKIGGRLAVRESMRQAREMSLPLAFGEEREVSKAVCRPVTNDT